MTMKITSIHTTPVLAPLPRPVRTASGTIGQFPLVLIDVHTDSDVVGRAYAQVYLPELLPALQHAVSNLAGMATGLPLAKIAARCMSGRSLADQNVTREIVPLVLNGPPSVTGFAGGRPKVEEIVAYWPALLDKRAVSTAVTIME